MLRAVALVAAACVLLASAAPASGDEMLQTGAFPPGSDCGMEGACGEELAPKGLAASTAGSPPCARPVWGVQVMSGQAMIALVKNLTLGRETPSRQTHDEPDPAIKTNADDGIDGPASDDVANESTAPDDPSAANERQRKAVQAADPGPPPGPPVVAALFFTTGGCAFSRAVWPLFETAARAFPAVRFVAVDAFHDIDANLQYLIRGLPAVAVFRKNAPRGVFYGSSSDGAAMIDFLSAELNVTVRPETLGCALQTAADDGADLSPVPTPWYSAVDREVAGARPQFYTGPNRVLIAASAFVVVLGAVLCVWAMTASPSAVWDYFDLR